MLEMSGNHIMTDQRCFEIGSNIGPSFKIGVESDSEAWFKAEFVGEGKSEPLFNGRLYHAGAEGHTTIIDNFPKSNAPEGWTKKIKVGVDGYDLIDDQGNTVFSYWDDGDGHVKVTLKLFGAGGQVIANTTPNSLQLYGVDFQM